jgi:uncharacterized protein YndB with AHSA1/START domain
MAGPFERLGPERFIALDWALVVVCVLDVLAGIWLWQGRRRGAQLGMATAPLAVSLGAGLLREADERARAVDGGISVLDRCQRVFALWTDLDRMREWVGGVTRVPDVTGPVERVGTRYTVWFGPMRSPTEVREVELAGRIRTRFGNWLLRGETLATFEAEDGGTRLIQVFKTQGLISSISARLFSIGSSRGSFRGELEAFGAIAEREAQSGELTPPPTRRTR